MILVTFYGFPGRSDGKESACNVEGRSQEDPLEEEMATHSSILAWEIPWTGVWWATVHGVRASEATEHTSVGYFPFFLAHSSSSKSTKPLTELFRNSSNLFFQFPFFFCSVLIFEEPQK